VLAAPVARCGFFPRQELAGPFATRTSPDSTSMHSAEGRELGTLGRQVRHERHRAGSHAPPPVQDRTEPRALPARQEVHQHFYSVTAEDVARILRGSGPRRD